MTDRPLICLFSRVRQEVLRESNIRRMLANVDGIVDAAVICDDGSTDGTAEAITDWVYSQGGHRGGTRVEAHPGGVVAGDQDARWVALRVHADHPERAFEKELLWKQRMLEVVHRIRPHFVLWMDADEMFDRAGTEGLRAFCEERCTERQMLTHEVSARDLVEPEVAAWAFHYTQLWRVSTWARTDDGFDDGWFFKLWRWTPNLVFDIPEPGKYKGLHHPQFPRQVMQAFSEGRVRRAPFEQIHYGNFGKNVQWKCLQYAGGLGGVDRHLRFERAEYRPVDPCSLPAGAEQWPTPPSDHHVANGALNAGRFLPSRPQPFSPTEIERILALGNLRGLPDTFTVVIPAYNRADTLGRALQSLLDQTYPQWVAVVLDDGSTDGTPAFMRHWQDRDPRIFYARYPENRGGVAMNEIGMALACEWTAWWTRLGSDDYFGPTKLARDAFALRDHDACYGTYQVLRDGAFMEVCNGPATLQEMREALLGKRFGASWANCAVRTSVLQSVRARYGHFCDPRLRNMEDFLVNARVARQSRGWVWRGMVDGLFVVNPTTDECRAITERFTVRRAVDELEAVWTCVTTGASGNLLQSTKDENLTRELLTRDAIAKGS